MGKHSPFSMDRTDPGCVWSMLHFIKYQHWGHIKKKFTPKCRGGGRVVGNQTFFYAKFSSSNYCGFLVALARHVNLVSYLYVIFKSDDKSSIHIRFRHQIGSFFQFKFESDSDS